MMPLINIFLLILAYRDKIKLDLEIIKQFFGIFYHHIAKKRKDFLWYNLIYFIRRLIFIFTSILLQSQKYQSCQFVIVCFLNILVSIFIIKVKVQRSKELNNLEIINEFLTQLATLHLPIFALCSQDYQPFFGITYISIILLTVTINSCIILKNCSFLFASFCIMLYKNRNNMTLKFKSLILSNETFF